MNVFIKPQQVQRILIDLQCTWGVAGGWALDLFLDRPTRGHEDVDVAIFREDQLILQGYFSSRGWSLEYVHNSKFYSWPNGERLRLPINGIWCRASSGPLDLIEVLLNECEGKDFVFRRNSSIKTPIERAFIRSKSGIPVLAPEIVLLYKSKRPMRDKEQQDFSNMLNALDVQRRQWLAESIATNDPEHPWLYDLRDATRVL